MNTPRNDKLDAFVRAVRAWVDGLGEPTGHAALWAIPVGWDDSGERTAGYLSVFLPLIVDSCVDYRERVKLLCREARPGDEDPEMLLLMLGPFHPGALGEIKTLGYQFGVIYHNVMNDFFGCTDQRVIEGVTKGNRLVSPPSARGSRGVSARRLQERLAAFGGVNETQVEWLAASLREAWRHACAIEAVIDQYEVYAGDNIWIGVVHFQQALCRLLRTIAVLEPLWSAYSNAKYVPPDGWQ